MFIVSEEFIEMARQADVWVEEGFLFEKELNARTIAFAERVASATITKTEAYYMQLFLDPENQPTQFGTATQEYRAQEIKEERERIANKVDGLGDGEPVYTWWVAEQIRAEGDKQ